MDWTAVIITGITAITGSALTGVLAHRRAMSKLNSDERSMEQNASRSAKKEDLAQVMRVIEELRAQNEQFASERASALHERMKMQEEWLEEKARLMTSVARLEGQNSVLTERVKTLEATVSRLREEAESE